MGLTATILTDIAGSTQTLTFSNPAMVDQIVFSNNHITLKAIASFNLSKVDMAIYLQYITQFNNLLFLNFPSFSSSLNLTWPISHFGINTSMSGVEHIIYTQSSQGTQVVQINYVPTALAGSFAARPSPVTITLQEWFMKIYMLTQYFNQIKVS